MGLPKLPDLEIGGHAWDLSSVEVAFGELIITRFTSLDYSESLSPSTLRGASSGKLGRTRGEYDSTGSFTLYKPDLQRLLVALSAKGGGAGYGEVPFDIKAVYGELATGTVTDVLEQVRITNLGDSHSTGGDALVVDVDIDIIQIDRNGLVMSSGGASGAALAATIGGAVGNL